MDNRDHLDSLRHQLARERERLAEIERRGGMWSAVAAALTKELVDDIQAEIDSLAAEASVPSLWLRLGTVLTVAAHA